MKTRLSLLVAVGLALALCSLTLAVNAADWPQWRGPERNGVSKETGLLKEWPKDGPKLLWQVKDLDEGYSTPAVVGDRLYVLSSKGNDDEYVQARGVKDGMQVWTSRLGKVGPNQMADYHGARSTPTVDGEFLYALGSDGDLVCLKAADGKEIWRKNLRSDFGGTPGLWAYSESPLVDGDVLICTPGGKEATLVALDKKKGDVIWKAPIPGGEQAGYASVIIVEAAGRKQYVQFLQKGVVGVDAKTGKFLWRYDQTAERSLANIATPVAHDGYVYTSQGKDQMGGLVRLKAGKDGIVAEPVYYEGGLPAAIGGSVQVGGYLYGTNGSGLICAEFTTGKVKWQDKSVAPGSVLCADGRLYVHGDNGPVALVEVTPEGYREKGRFTPPDQPKHKTMEKAWAYPVVANGRLYLRDLNMLWCYDVKDPKAAK
jgi:outer membrane protein assembly factor BamB